MMDKDEEETKMNQMGASEDLKVQVLSMGVYDNDDLYFKVRRGNEIDKITRGELIKLDPIALIVFYESNV